MAKYESSGIEVSDYYIRRPEKSKNEKRRLIYADDVDGVEYEPDSPSESENDNDRDYEIKNSQKNKQ